MRLLILFNYQFFITSKSNRAELRFIFLNLINVFLYRKIAINVLIRYIKYYWIYLTTSCISGNFTLSYRMIFFYFIKKSSFFKKMFFLLFIIILLFIKRFCYLQFLSVRNKKIYTPSIYINYYLIFFCVFFLMVWSIELMNYDTDTLHFLLWTSLDV